MIEKFRDVMLMKLGKEHTLTVVCDSCGGIGKKEHDPIQVDPYITGYYTACVVLAETIAIGAMPMTVVNTLAVEMNDTGKAIIEGISAALDEIGLDRDTMLTGSTEENIPVMVTGLGITVIGRLDGTWTHPQAQLGNIIVVVGLPKVGDDVVQDQGEIMNLPTLLKLRAAHYVMDLLPVGSKGIEYEASEMGRTSGLTCRLYEEPSIDIIGSAGPATCAIVAMDPSYIEELKNEISLPIHIIGEFQAE